MIRRLFLTVVTTTLLGCAAPKTMYEWGSYEELIYVSYAAPGTMLAEQQIEAMEQDYQKARAHNKRVPPGWHAHLGHLYYQVGKHDQALQQLTTEKTEYPESTVFVDRLIANIH